MFYFDKKSVDICLEKEEIKIISKLGKENIVNITYRQVLTIQADNSNLVMNYVIKKKQKTLEMMQIKISGSTSDVYELCNRIKDNLNDRPKRLLVIINPNSGKRKGIKVYQKYAAPLFQLCGVQADVFVTSKPKEPTDILKHYNLSDIDGIVTVGGDGLYCECMNGLVTRVQEENSVNLNSHRSDIIPATIPIGIIPAGSGDVIVQYLHGTRCVRTAVLHILLGNRVDSNIVGVYEGGKLLSYSALVLGFGLFGDMMFECEKFRWMGSTRYSIIPLGCMFKRRDFDVEVTYFPYKRDEHQKESHDFVRQKSLPNASLHEPRLSVDHRTKSTSDLLGSNIEQKDCITQKERVYAVDCHPIMMKEKGGRMTPSFGEESLMVYTTSKCKLSDHISQLTKVKNEKPDCYEYDFVYNHEVSSFRVKLTNTTVTMTNDTLVLQKDCYINCDGEVIRLNRPVFDVKFHRKAVRFFGDVAD